MKVQRKIEDEAAKFVFLLSNISCDFERKKGVYREVQAASNLRRDNFVIPFKLEPLKRTVPILVGTDIYIEGENLAHGLKELEKRLKADGVPIGNRNQDEILQWWPALHVEERVRNASPHHLTSNICPIISLPANVYVLQVYSDGNVIAGRDRLKNVLPTSIAWSAYGEYVISFGSAEDLQSPLAGFDIKEVERKDTKLFIAEGYKPALIEALAARNTCTYFVASALEDYLSGKGLRSKSSTYTRKKLWYPADELLPNNRVSLSEPQKRTVPIHLVGRLSHYNKRYVWHFGVQPTIDLHTHFAVIFSPRAAISVPYKTSEEQHPVLVDDKRALKQLGWWNKEWRQKLLAFLAWLSGQSEIIDVPVASQRMQISARPIGFDVEQLYREVSDDQVLREIVKGGVE